MLKPSLPSLALAGLIALAGAARAQDKQEISKLYKPNPTPLYQGCDGYGATTDVADNYTEFGAMFGLYTLSTFAGTHTMPTDGRASAVAACDGALAVLPPQYWIRKVSLLRARAIHNLEQDKPKDALADLDAADAAAKPEPYYQHSLGWSLDVVRAYAWRKAGDQTKASTLALAALDRDPYNRLTVYAVLNAIGPHASVPDLLTVQQAISRLSPTYIDLLFHRAQETGHYDDVLKLHAQLVPPEEIGQVNVSRFDQAGRDWRNFRTARLFFASRDGSYAYALAAVGRNEEALAAIAAARTRLANDTQPPPPLPAEKQKDHDEVALYNGDVDIRTRSAAEGAKYIDQWEQFVKLRIAASEGKADDILAALKARTLPRNWVSVDIIESLRKTMPAAKRRMLPSTDALQKEFLAARDDVKDVTATELLKNLPETDTARRVPSYSEGGSPWFGHSETAIVGSGYRVSRPDANGVVLVSFRGDGKEPAAVIEEMALLCAADQARRAGRKGLVVVGRQDTEFSLTTTYYATPVNTSPAGYETTLNVVFVDPAALPDRFKDAPWRVIDADAAYAALAPLYIRPKN